jgi:hypothetical protein
MKAGMDGSSDRARICGFVRATASATQLYKHATNLNQLRFDRRSQKPHNARMHEAEDRSKKVLIGAVFCAIIGLIVLAGLLN